MPYITTRFETWAALVFLLSVHLGTNYAAVRAVIMRTLNRQRSNILFPAILNENKVLSPAEVSKRERIFEWDGALRWQSEHSSRVLGSCRIGVSPRELLSHSSPATSRSVDLGRLLGIFEDEQYMLWLDRNSKRAAIVLKTQATPACQLKAWWHALLISKELASERTQYPADKTVEKRQCSTVCMYTLLEETLETVSAVFDQNLERLQSAGWDVGNSSLETSLGRRVEISAQ